MAFDRSAFDAKLDKKYEIAQQNADTEAARVAQQPALADAANQAALQRTALEQTGATARLGLQGQQGLEQGAQANAGRLAAVNAQGGFGLQEAAMRGQTAQDVANIQGGYGLGEANIRAQGALAVAQQPEFGAIRNDNSDTGYSVFPKNQAAWDQVQGAKPKAPALPGGLSSPPAQTVGSGQGGGFGLNEGLTTLPRKVYGTGAPTDPYRYAPS